MKITHYIQPRYSGKTNYANELNKKEGVLIVPHNWIKSFKPIRGESGRFHTLIIDEYIFLYWVLSENNRLRVATYIREELSRLLTVDGEIILISTPEKRYNEEVYVLANIINFPEFMQNNLLYESLNIDLEKYKKDIREIQGQFLSPNTARIKIGELGETLIPLEKRVEMKEQLGTEKYETEINANFIKLCQNQ